MSTRTTSLRIRLTPAEKKAWIKDAKTQAEGNISRYVRACVNEARERTEAQSKARP